PVAETRNPKMDRGWLPASIQTGQRTPEQMNRFATSASSIKIFHRKELPMLRLREVAERLNCSLANVYALKDSGLLRCVATGANGKGLRVELAELERFIRERQQEPPGKNANRFPAKSNPLQQVKLKHLR